MKFIRLSSFMLFSLMMMSFTKGDIDISKTITESVAVNSNTHLKVNNKCGPIEFISTTGNEAKIEATLLVEGESKEEIQKVLDQFELLVAESGSIIDVVAEDNIENWVQVNTFFVKKNTITFEDGKKAYDITKMEVSLVVYLPQVEKLSAYNKYDDVRFDNLNCDVDIEMFSGNFTGGDINGDLDLDLKYGEINIGNIGNVDFTLFDCDSKVGNAKELNLNVKYSDIEFEDVVNCEMQSFDDEIKLGNIEQEFKLDAKYSNIVFGNFKNGDLELFDCDTKANDGENIKLDSKYGNHTFGDLSSISLELFQDEVSIGDLTKLNGRNTKYSSVSIDQLAESFEVVASFQDDFDIDVVGEGITSLELEGKYTDLDFPIPSDIAYRLDADLRYSTFVFPDSCDNSDRDNGDQAYSILCDVNNPGEKSLQVKINLFDGDVIIK